MRLVRIARDWVNDQVRRRTPIYALAMDNRIYVAVVTGILSGIYG